MNKKNNKAFSIVGLFAFSMATFATPIIMSSQKINQVTEVIETLNTEEENQFDLATLKIKSNVVNNIFKGVRNKKIIETITPDVDSNYKSIDGLPHGPLSDSSVTTVYGGESLFNFIQKNENRGLSIVATPIDESSFNITIFDTNFETISSAIFFNNYLVISGKVKNQDGFRVGLYKVGRFNKLVEVLNPNLPSSVIYSREETTMSQGIVLSPYTNLTNSTSKEILAFPMGLTFAEFKDMADNSSFKKISIQENGTINVTNVGFKVDDRAPVEHSDIIRAITPIYLNDIDKNVYIATKVQTGSSASGVSDLFAPEHSSPLNANYHLVIPLIAAPLAIDLNDVIPYKKVAVDKDGAVQLFWIFQDHFYNPTLQRYPTGNSSILTNTLKLNQTGEWDYSNNNPISMDAGTDIGWTSSAAIIQINYSADVGNFNDSNDPFFISVMINRGLGDSLQDITTREGVFRWANSDNPDTWNRSNLPTPTVTDSPILTVASTVQPTTIPVNQKYMSIVNQGIFTGVGILDTSGNEVFISTSKKNVYDRKNFYTFDNWTFELKTPLITLEVGDELPDEVPKGRENELLIQPFTRNYFSNFRNDQVTDKNASFFKKVIISKDENNVTDKISFDLKWNARYLLGEFVFPDPTLYEIVLMTNPLKVGETASDLKFLINENNPNFKVDPSNIQNRINTFNEFSNPKDIEGIIGFAGDNMININESLFNSIDNIVAIPDDTYGNLNIKINFLDPNGNTFSKEINLAGMNNKLFIIPAIIAPIALFTIIIIIVSIILIAKNKRKETLSKKAGFLIGQKSSQSHIVETKIDVLPKKDTTKIKMGPGGMKKPPPMGQGPTRR